ncbi:MAG TPA: 30S ribosomal protein S20, partial [Terriglobia bacterium]|nr:30S ribosomal protein S20 [Terriglobia bacterium]
MANHKSALKRLSQTRKRTERNRAHRTRMRHQIREL